MGWRLRYRPGSEDVTGAVGWVSGQGTLVFWFNKNCASQGPWGRRHRGTRDPARSRARPGERRSVHKSAKMASRSCFGAFVYTVATCEGHARVRGDAGVYTNRRKWPLGAVLGHSCTLLRLARVARKWHRHEAGVFAETATHTNPEESSIETRQVSKPIDARFGRFWLVGRLWCVERCARLTKRARAGRPPRPSRTGLTQPT